MTDTGTTDVIVADHEDANEDSGRKLATITSIKGIKPIPDADRIELATFTTNGWSCVVGKNELAVGDKVIFFEIDSFLPIDERYAILAKCRKEMKGEEGYRIKSQTFRGEISQGFTMPLSRFPELADGAAEDGTDVTQPLGVKLWQKPLSSGGGFNIGKPKGDFPHFVQKTDQERIQSLGRLQIANLFEHTFEVTEKLDGTSMTAFASKSLNAAAPECDYNFGVCSRNLELQESGFDIINYMRPATDEEEADQVDEKGGRWIKETKSVEIKSIYWDMAHKHHLRERLVEYCKQHDRNLAVQGEICGPGLQKNPLGLKEVQFFVFDIFDIATRRYIPATERAEILAEMNAMGDNPLQSVPFVGNQKIAPTLAQISRAMAITPPAQNEDGRVSDTWPVFLGNVVDLVIEDLLRQADLPGHFSKVKEGLVFKSLQDASKSFKVISNKYLLKEKD